MRETINAWRQIILDPKPTALILSRPDLPQLSEPETLPVVGKSRLVVQRVSMPLMEVIFFAEI